MKLIDTNVLVYALGGPHPYKASSQKIMEKYAAGEIEVNISTEVLQEILDVYHRRQRNPEFALRAFDQLVIQFPSPFPILTGTARTARDILERNPRLQARDAFHIAVVFEHRLEGIISVDRAFDQVAGLKRFDPKELAA